VPTEDGREETGWAPVAVDPAPLDLVAAEPAARPWLTLAATAIVGVILGAAGMHYLDHRPQELLTPIDVRVSLAAQAGTMSLVNGEPVVSVPLVLNNAGPQPVTLTSIRLSGPGASLVSDPEGRPSQALPWVLVPGRAVEVRIGLRSDCAVLIRPPPHVTLVVTDSERQVHDLSVTVPDLDSIWGQTLVPGACPNQG
jgi:hypothetical protein